MYTGSRFPSYIFTQKAVNATSAFEAVGHSSEALQQMKQLLVGEVENYDPASDEAAAACSIC